ncbi:MAG: hypothetical protein J2P21_00170 [Chloracidobacterium sp.]|nr:hypothetical protein [Chloracidobacterium sp.]
MSVGRFHLDLRRLILAGIGAEIVSVMLQIGIIIHHGVTHETSETLDEYQQFARNVRYFVGPFLSFAVTFLFVLWIGRRLKNGSVITGAISGVLIGFIAAGAEASLMFVFRGELELFLIPAALIKVLAGYLAGVILQKWMERRVVIQQNPA